MKSKREYTNINTHQKWSAIFLLFSFSFLLTHSVVPHLHHDHKICLPTIHNTACDNDTHCDDDIAHKNHTHHNHHNSHGDFEKCNIEKVLVRKSELQNQRLWKDFSNSLFVLLTLEKHDFVKSIDFVSKTPPEHIKLSSFCKSVGLRAPPVA